MDVIPTVAQETATRYHKKAGERPMSSAVTAELAALLTRLWLLNSKEGLDDAGDVASTVPAIEQQVDSMVDYLLHRCNPPSLSTLSLQVRCDAARATHTTQSQQTVVRKEAIGVQLEDALLSMEPGLVTPEQVWAGLAVSLLHHYGSGTSLLTAASAASSTATQAAPASTANGSSNPAYGEAVSAVSAALPRPQVPGFLRQDRVERAGQLRQLRRIAWGLRLYQKEVGRSAGTDMVSLTAAVDVPLRALEAKCAEALTTLETRLRPTRALLTAPTCALPAAAFAVLREEYHHLLLMLHILKCVDCSLRQLRECVTERVLRAFQSTLAELRDLLMPNRKGNTVNTTTTAAATAPGGDGDGAAVQSEAAPKKVVFPKFMELADAYELGVGCTEEYNYYAVLLQIVAESAEGYASTLPVSAAEDAVAREQAVQQQAIDHKNNNNNNSSSAAAAAAAAALAAEVTSLLESEQTRQRLPADVYVRYSPELPLHTVDAVIGQHYPQSLCAMRGCCPVSYVEGRPAAGLLLPGCVPQSEAATQPHSGDVALGCVEVSGGVGADALPRPLHFLFADAAAMRAFARDPWRYVRGCLRVFHPEEPTVSLVMGLADELPRELYLDGARTVEKVCSVSSRTQAVQGKADCGTQTGQIDSYIDHNYFWNEWDLRRHALKLANLMHMRTHSSQTTASHFRREATTQVNPTKDSETQTLQDAATQPPRVVQYIKGLRGTESSAVEQVQSTVEY